MTRDPEAEVNRFLRLAAIDRYLKERRQIIAQGTKKRNPWRASEVAVTLVGLNRTYQAALTKLGVPAEEMGRYGVEI